MPSVQCLLLCPRSWMLVKFLNFDLCTSSLCINVPQSVAHLICVPQVPQMWHKMWHNYSLQQCKQSINLKTGTNYNQISYQQLHSANDPNSDMRLLSLEYVKQVLHHTAPHCTTLHHTFCFFWLEVCLFTR